MPSWALIEAERDSNWESIAWATSSQAKIGVTSPPTLKITPPSKLAKGCVPTGAAGASSSPGRGAAEVARTPSRPWLTGREA